MTNNTITLNHITYIITNIGFGNGTRWGFIQHQSYGTVMVHFNFNLNKWQY